MGLMLRCVVLSGLLLPLVLPAEAEQQAPMHQHLRGSHPHPWRPDAVS